MYSDLFCLFELSDDVLNSVLTVWDNIKGGIVNMMETIRMFRIERERIKRRQKIVARLVETYTYSRPQDEIIPSTADLCNMEEFEAILYSPDVKVDDDSFSGSHVSPSRIIRDMAHCCFPFSLFYSSLKSGGLDSTG